MNGTLGIKTALRAAMLPLLLGVAACGGGSQDPGPAPGTEAPGSTPPPTSAPPATPPPATAPPVTAPPVIVALDIHGAPTAGGTPVVITGAGFQPGLTVTFGTAEATGVAVDVSGTSITCTTPPQLAGIYDVVVTNPDGQSSTASGFHYGPPPSPVSFFPASAPPAATITVLGSDFVPGMTGGTQVRIGGVDAPIVSSIQLSRSASSPIEDVVTVPNLAPGSYQVVVTNPDGQQAVVPGVLVVP